MKVLIAGDFVPRHRIAEQIEDGDFRCLDEVKPVIQSADYAIVNFESPVVIRNAKPIGKTGPNLRCTEKAIECVAQAGFNCVTLANNHFRDFGQIGVEDTIDSCEKYGVDYVGGGKTKQGAERILYKTIYGQTLAIINVCENEWSIASEYYGGSNPLNPIRNYYAIHEAKKNADYVLVIVHGGIEGYNLPTPRMLETYHFFVDSGADAVVNHHQHCYSGYEEYHGKPIFYGLGNFCFDTTSVYRNELWIQGFMVELQFSETIIFRLFPYKQCDEDYSAVKNQVDKDLFVSSIEQLNYTIANVNQLEQQYRSYISQGSSIAKNILAPYTNSIVRKLYAKGFLPSFVSKYRKNQLLAYIQCESHRDILLQGLLNECNV
jgi:poly-gamma-glutamate synthesis protein (capsule biosynthesis protein)